MADNPEKTSGKRRLAIDLTAGEASDAVDLTGDASDSDDSIVEPVSGKIAIDLTEDPEAIDLLDSDSEDSTDEPDWLAMNQGNRQTLPQIPTKSVATKSVATKSVATKSVAKPKETPISHSDPVHVPATPDSNPVETIPTVTLGGTKSTEKEMPLRDGPQNSPTSLQNMEEDAPKPTELPTAPQPRSPTKPPSVPKPKSPTTKLYPNGTPIWKQFEDPITKRLTWYDGQVVGYDPVERYYKVQYSDGDIEEFTPAELHEQLKNYHSRFLETGGSPRTTIPVDNHHSPTNNKEPPPNSGKTKDEISCAIQNIPAKAANSNRAMENTCEERNGKPLVLSTGIRLRPRVKTTTTSAVVTNPKATRKRKSPTNQEQSQSDDPVHVLCDKDANRVHTVILDTMPNHSKSNGEKLSCKEILLRGGNGPQVYGSSQHPFWNIVGTALGFQRPLLPYKEQVQWLTQRGYAIWDLLAQKRNENGSVVPSDLPQFVRDHPNLRRFVFVGDSAKTFREDYLLGEWLRTNRATITVQEKDGTSRKEAAYTQWWIQGRNLQPTSNRTNFFFGGQVGVKILYDASNVKTYKSLKCTNWHRADDMDGNDAAEIQGRAIELMVIPSPKNSLLRPTEIEKTWHQACFGLQEPPEDYRCVGCELRSRTRNEVEQLLPRHWLHDCPFREEWEVYMKQLSKQIIDPFYWYM